MAGLLYLPRLFVYHAGAGPGGQSETFKTMERKLLRFIMVPAMLLSWITGVTLAVQGAHFHAFWFHSKMLAVVLLTAFTFTTAFSKKPSLRTATHARRNFPLL